MAYRKIPELSKTLTLGDWAEACRIIRPEACETMHAWLRLTTITVLELRISLFRLYSIEIVHHDSPMFA